MVPFSKARKNPKMPFTDKDSIPAVSTWAEIHSLAGLMWMKPRDAVCWISVLRGDIPFGSSLRDHPPQLQFQAVQPWGVWELFAGWARRPLPTLDVLGALCACTGLCPLRDSNKSQAATLLQLQGSIMCMDVGMVYGEELTVQLSWLMGATLEIKGSV